MMLFRKIVSVFTACVLLTCVFAVLVSASGRKTALPVSAGINALRDEFDIDTAPEADGYALDYAYYSPVGNDDSTKYPLVIFLHGIGHGDYKGSQLADSDFPYWASAELQARFTEGGAFLLLPRAPEHKLVYWSNSLIASLRSVIDDVIAKHGDNINTEKIFIGGLSAGGEMTWNMISAFPEYFAGAFPMAPTGTISASVVKKCADVPIWLIASSKDPVISYIASVTPLWNNVCKYNNNPAACRFSVFSDVREPDGGKASDNHHMAKVITYDFHMLDGSTYPNVSHKDGNGNSITLESPDGIISWMNGLSSSYNGESGNGTGNNNVSGINDFFNMIRNFFLKIVNMFQRLFGLA